MYVIIKLIDGKLDMKIVNENYKTDDVLLIN